MQTEEAKIIPIDDSMTAAIYDELVKRLVPVIMEHLENHTNTEEFEPFQKGDGPKMATKINRVVTIAGKKHWIHANTEQEYAEKLMMLCSRESTPGTLHSFEKYSMSWFELYALPTVATATAATYKRQLTKYLIPHFDGIAVENITVDDVQRLFNGMKGTKATKDKVKMVLNMVLDAAVEDGLLLKNPLQSKRLKITGKASTVTEAYQVEEMRYIIKNIGNIKLPCDRIYLALQALHPLRLEEVLGLKWEDIDLENEVIHVRRAVTHPTRNQPEIKATKTEASVRDLSLSSIAVQYLTPGNPNEFVCGGAKPLSYTELRHLCQRIEKDIQFQGKITPIRFRATVLTDLYDVTKDIKQTQAAAGHTTSAMTLKHYVKGRESASATTATVIDSIYGPLPQ